MLAQGGWYDAEPDPARQRVVYSVVREFDELNNAEIWKHAKEVAEAKEKKMAAW